MRQPTVLVVDDDPTTRRCCEAALQSAGYRVETAADGETALEWAEARRQQRDGYDLAVLDYLMPGRHGLETFRELRRLQPDIAAVLVSGHTSLDVAVEALNRGFSQVLPKPVVPADLVEAVATALQERRVLRENSRLRALTRLYDSLKELTAVAEPAELYRRIIALAAQETSANRVSLMLLDEREAVLKVVAASGLSPEVVHDARRGLGEPVSGWVLHHGVVLEMGPDKHVPATVRDALQRPEVTASVCLPLRAAGEPLGVLNISRLDSQDGFNPGDVELATILAADAALTIQRLNLMHHRARRERISTVGRLASTIIHDLRGPVTIIGGAAEMLEEANPQATDSLLRIRGAVNELEGMCSQLLRFARGNTGAMIDRFSLADLIREVVEPTDAGPAWITTEIDETIELEAARAELQRALTDVLENARLAAREGSRLRLTTHRDGRMVELRIDGEAEQAQDWWPELDEPSALAAGGSGLSLTLLRYLVERHRGDLTIELTEPNYRLRIRLPEAASVAA